LAYTEEDGDIIPLKPGEEEQLLARKQGYRVVGRLPDKTFIYK